MRAAAAAVRKPRITRRAGRHRGGCRRRRLRGRHRPEGAVRAHHDRRAAARGRRRRGEVRDRAQRGTATARPGSRVALRPRPPSCAATCARRARRRAPARPSCAPARSSMPAGVGFLAGCGVTEVPTTAPSARGHHLHRQRARAAHPGSHCGQDPQLQRLRAGCVPPAPRARFPPCCPSWRTRSRPRRSRCSTRCCEYDFVVTSGGASNGDFDFIKPVVEAARRAAHDHREHAPGKAQTFGVVQRHARVRSARQPGCRLRGLRDASSAPRCARCRGIPNLAAPAREGDASRATRRRTTRAASSCAPPSQGRRDGALRGDAGEEPELGAVRRHPAQQLHGRHARGRGRRARPARLVDCILLDVTEDVVPVGSAPARSAAGTGRRGRKACGTPTIGKRPIPASSRCGRRTPRRPRSHECDAPRPGSLDLT